MKTIEIKTQEELDALPDSFNEYTLIKITGGTEFNKIIVRKARESSHVVARGSSHVVACGSSHVEARGSSHVVAWDSSHVVARESSYVEACGSSHVVARESSHVVAWDSVCVHNHSATTTVELFAFVVCILLQKGKVVKKSKTCTIIEPVNETGVAGWLNRHAIKAGKTVTLFKRVSDKFQTQEGTENETEWKPGTEQVHKNWNPEGEECGAGKFHACPIPYFCDEFRSEPGDRYVAIRIKIEDLHAWDNGNYPHKIAFRAGTVIFECDRYGKEISQPETNLH